MLIKDRTILFVMPRLPFPASSGRKTSLYHYCRILSEELGYRLVVAAFLEEGDDPKKKPVFIDKLIILPKPSKKIKMWNILFDSVLLKKKPMQVALYWNPKAKKIIDNIVKEEAPEIVIADMVRCTEYIRDINAYRIADLDDRISLRYERQIKVDLDNINPYGAYLHTMPKILQKIMLWHWVKRYIVKNEIKLLKKYELDMGNICEKIVFVAQKEVDEFNYELGEQKAIAIPIGVDEVYFSYRSTHSIENYIGFLGAMSVAHNENSVRYFINNILPLVLAKIPDVKFLVIGGGASEDLRKLQSKYVKFTGKVDDVRDYLKKCKVFVCPMSFGSGIKTKNLEAMAMGIPVVTTSIGAENIDAVNGSDWIIADNPYDFAENICILLKNDDLRLNISQNCRQYIENNWSWKRTRDIFKNLLLEGSE